MLDRIVTGKIVLHATIKVALVGYGFYLGVRNHELVNYCVDQFEDKKATYELQQKLSYIESLVKLK